MNNQANLTTEDIVDKWKAMQNQQPASSITGGLQTNGYIGYYPPQPYTCPTCGKCPTCGRGGYPHYYNYGQNQQISVTQ